MATPRPGGVQTPVDYPGGARLMARRRAAGVTRTLWQPALVALMILVGTPLFGSSSVYPLLVLAGIYGVAVVGVSVLAGLGGQITLGHAVFMAIGAYSSALCTVRWNLPPLVGAGAGIVAALALALITSPILRLRGWYLAMATIAVMYLAQQLLVGLGGLTGGNNGIYGIPNLSLAGLEARTETDYFTLAWSLVLAFFLLGRSIARSRYGRSLTAVHKDAEAAAAVGINPARAKIVLWLLASVPAAVAGSLFSHYSAFIAPSDFAFSTSLILFAAVVIGGERSIFGGLVVVSVLTALSAYTTQILTTDFVEALAMMVVYLLSPLGLAGVGDQVIRTLRRRGARHA
jgi:branched-chain amino acid transport system permease protein